MWPTDGIVNIITYNDGQWKHSAVVFNELMNHNSNLYGNGVKGEELFKIQEMIEKPPNWINLVSSINYHDFSQFKLILNDHINDVTVVAAIFADLTTFREISEECNREQLIDDNPVNTCSQNKFITIAGTRQFAWYWEHKKVYNMTRHLLKNQYIISLNSPVTASLSNRLKVPQNRFHSANQSVREALLREQLP